LQNYSDIVTVVTFVKRIDYQNIRGTAAITFKLRKRAEDEQLPLVAERAVCNVAILCHSVGYVPT
jgi:hypothetical protein